MSLTAPAVLAAGDATATTGAAASASHSELDEILAMTPLEMVAGGIAGFCEHTVMFPCDTIKSRMQQRATEAGHRSMRDTFVRVLREERVTHLYRGCTPVVMSAVPAHAAYFGLYEATKRAVGGDAAAPQYAAAAAAATFGHDAVSTPFEVVKTRMQVDSERRFASSFGCARSILRSEGIMALFVSFPTTVCMNVPQIATHWIVYESCKAYLTEVRHQQEDEKAFHFIASGLLAGACAAVVSAPLDVVRTQLQLGNPIHNPARLAQFVYARGGIQGLFTGVVPRICFMAPSAAIVMTVYEKTKVALEAMFPNAA